MDLWVSVPGDKFLKVAAIWHEDEHLNRMLGFGSGEAGQTIARSRLQTAISPQRPEVALWTLNRGTRSIGYAVMDTDGYNRSVDLGVVLEPGSTIWVYRQAMLLVLDKLFSAPGGKVFRVTFRPLKRNTPMVKLAYQVGLVKETITKGSLWVDNTPEDQFLFRMVRTEWANRRG
jgi:RimJ/RimL family protein N-acetyltransferase